TVKRIRPGQMITGTVLQIVDGEVFVNIGYKADGVIPKGEFSADPEVRAEDVVKEGDSIDVEVLMVNDGEGNVRLSRKNVEGRKLMDEMFAEDVEGKTFEAVIKEVVKGGLIADINGVRAFIPASHVSTKYVENLNDYVGKTVKVKVLEADKAKKRIVASIKQVLVEEAKAAKAAKWDALVVGEKVHGVVRRITDFGAFVDIGGLDGLVHVTDCAWGRVKHPSDALSIGQEIEVLILRVDREKEQIGLGYKQLQPKPWTKAAEKYPIGSIVEGKVVRIVPFGAFVALEPTIDGLIHISQVGIHRIEKVEDEIKVGDIVRCKVLDVNVEAKRISLSRKDALIEENPEIAEQLAAEKAERERVNAERKAQREAQREQQNKEREERNARRAQDNGERRESRPDRRRRNSEDGEYELPPVTQTTTSLASLFANFKADEE
ncbi:MAG: 30S ribosomal protein S1, partial [Clostridia bacterium]|nr:30S ribosomal protein S1 [Clostridia bacterium]